jgi:UDP-N-acetylmuramoylalanine-D-glutamate ligase
MLFDDFKDAMRDEGDTDGSIRLKIEAFLGRLRSTMHSFRIDGISASSSNEFLSLSFDALAPEQVAIATEIISAVEQNTKKLMFLQGSAGTGKTHTVRMILSELERLGIRCLVSGTTGIAAVQYPEGQTVHSLFRLGLDE